MPGLNGMGPNGTGPMTGKNRGYCNLRNVIVEPGNRRGLKRGQLSGRFAGLGGRCGMGQGFGANPGRFNRRTEAVASEQITDDEGSNLQIPVNWVKNILEQSDRHLIRSKI